MQKIKKEYEPLYVGFFHRHPDLLKVPPLCEKYKIIKPDNYWFIDNTLFIEWKKHSIVAKYANDKDRFYFQTPQGSKLIVEFIKYKLKKR